MLMGDISSSVQLAMQSLGKELDKYLDEARGLAKENVKEEKTLPEEKKERLTHKLFKDFYSFDKPKEAKVIPTPSPVALATPVPVFDRKEFKIQVLNKKIDFNIRIDFI